MPSILRMLTTVLPGNRLNVSDPTLPEGEQVEIIVMVPAKSQPEQGSLLDFLSSLPPGPRAFNTWQEYEQHIQQERNSWDR